MKQRTYATDTRRRSLFVPLILIVFGGYALAQRLGWATAPIGQILANTWPILLIGAGLNLIFGRSRPWVGAFLALVVISSVVMVQLFGVQFMTKPVQVQAFSESRTSIRLARITLDGSGSDFTLRPLPAADLHLLDGTFRSSRATLDKHVTTDDGIADVLLDSTGEGWFSFGGGNNVWDVALSPDLPLELILTLNAVNANVDLSSLNITTLNLAMNAGEGTITLPNAAQSTITIDANAASLTLVVPPGTEARIIAETSASNVDADARFSKNGNIYTTAGWDKADVRLDINLDASAAGVTVK